MCLDPADPSVLPYIFQYMTLSQYIHGSGCSIKVIKLYNISKISCKCQFNTLNAYKVKLKTSFSEVFVNHKIIKKNSLLRNFLF